MEQFESFYITTPIYYVNDKPHIGHAYTSLICDVTARFMKLAGKNVKFTTGTDEHGQKIEKAAKVKGIEPKEFTDEISVTFRKLAELMNFDYDDFIRTTEERHEKAVIALWNRLEERGQIYLDSYSGWYSVRDEAYYQESELIDGRAPTGAEVQWIKEESYFFRLSSWQNKLLELYENQPNFIFPESRKNEVVSFVKSGLTDISISRTIVFSKMNDKFPLWYYQPKVCPVLFVHKVLKKYPGTGVCGITPPLNFRPACHIKNTQLNFKAANQYLHRMYTRMGNASRELCVIRLKPYPSAQRSPVFEGLEVDLVKLFHAVQKEGGYEACQNDKEKWQIVAKNMKIYNTKNSSKLENIYLKYLLSYNSISSVERDNAKAAVDKCWAKREKKALERADIPLWRQRLMCSMIPNNVVMSPIDKVCSEVEECVTPGSYCNYISFKKLSQQVMGTYFPNNSKPTPEEVELVYWEIVTTASAHVCVHAASVDAVNHGAGFTEDKGDKFSNHPWNLKCLLKNPNNLLSYLGPSIGVSSPSLQFGMLFSISCWHKDPTSVPWIEYLHTGPPKIWYSVTADQSDEFRAAAEALCPFAVQKKEIWLLCDILMIPPIILRQYGVIVERHVQYPGEIVIVYPNTYCACIDTGFSISEGVYFAPHNWINSIDHIFLTLRTNCEPSLFSMDKLLISMVNNRSTPDNLLQRVNTVLISILLSELSYRQRLSSRGIELMSPAAFLEQNVRASTVSWQVQDTAECAYCRCHLYLSRVTGITRGQTSLCAMHGLHLFEQNITHQVQLSKIYCILLLTNVEINRILKTLKKRVMGCAEH